LKRHLRWLIPLLALLVLAAFIGRAIVARKAPAPVLAAAGSAGLDLAPSDIIVARMLDLPRTLDVSGGLKAVNTAMIKAKVAAEVRTLTVREGDSVKAGQVLGQLDTAELDLRLKQAQQTAASTRSQLEIAQRSLVNNRALVAQGFISPTALESSISTEAGAQATLGAALSAVDLAKKARADAALVAPIAGLVSQRLVQPGERVPIDAKLIEIVDLSRIELEAAIAPEDVVSLEVGKPATLRVDGIAAPVPAKVARINPSAQAGTRAIMAYLAVEPQPALRQGLFATGTIELGRKQALALPLAVVRTDQAAPYVLQVVGGKAVLTRVTLGPRGAIDGEAWVEIASGLADGARVLGPSAGLVRDGTPLRLPAAAANVATPVASSVALATSGAAPAGARPRP
jgi:RND family efflux transporter MFP subunit